MRPAIRERIDELSNFKANGDQVTSFYLTTDKSRMTRKEILANVKSLVIEGEAKVAAMNLSKDKKDALLGDLAGISSGIQNTLSSITYPGLAIFSASRLGFREDVPLPHGPRNRLVFDSSFFIRPLAAIVDKYPRICVLLLGRREAVWYGVYMGGIKLLDKLETDIPARAREGGYSGYEGDKIERHIDAHVQDHFKTVAKKTFEIFQKGPYDWLMIGCDDGLLPGLVGYSHTYLKDKFKVRLKLRPSDPPDKVLKAVMEAETNIKAEEEKAAIQKFVSELESGGRAVSGLQDTLASINRFEIQSLIVSHNFSKPGFVCPEQGFLYLDQEQCPVCRLKTQPVTDIIDEAVEMVLKRKGAVKQIDSPSKLDHYGHIGAFLKYKA